MLNTLVNKLSIHKGLQSVLYDPTDVFGFMTQKGMGLEGEAVLG